jgi:hypothetical protein
VFGAIVLALYVSGVGGSTVNFLSMSILVARVMQSLVHVCLVQTHGVVAVRFAFFFVQIVSFLALVVTIVRQTGLTP